MPSPFPGMDPYLESDSWRDVHSHFITYLSDDLNGVLGSNYVARTGERVVVESAAEQLRGILPDVHVVRRRPEGGGIAVAEHTEPVRVRIEEFEFREPWLEIRDRRGTTVVTVVELLSPSNKARGSNGRREYLRKQREVLESNVHLVEIDLLRAGKWALAIPEAAARDVCDFDYLVSVSRATDREEFELYPVRLEARLPRIKIPLAGKDPDVVADLQPLIDRCYD
ncbi:MAG: DUF4058 family protein, partial [Planctomycetes bacterium]|nr:DUF4058 family protein [Planctomycetota bacterium]